MIGAGGGCSGYRLACKMDFFPSAAVYFSLKEVQEDKPLLF
jgi:hypothetical protein